MDKKVKEALGSASYLTYHWRQYSFEQLEKEMVRVCGLCNKALGIPKDDSITDFDRGQWSVIQNVIGYVENYSLAAELCREAGIGYKKIKALQKDCGYSYKQGGRIKMRSPPKVLTGNFRPSQLSFFLS